MKILSVVGIKGGIGKSTFVKNIISRLKTRLLLNNSSKKILVIDLDHQCNLTQSYGIYESEGTVVNIFKRNDEVSIVHVDDKVDIIPGAMDLDIIESELETKSFKDMLMYMWFEKNYDKIDGDQYEYVIIDCRPDFSIATRNAIAISHMLLSPIIPSQYSLDARHNLETRLRLYCEENIDYKTGESNIDAELYFVGNMIKHNTATSKSLLSELENDDKVLGCIPHKELFNRATMISDENGVQPSVYDLIETGDYDVKQEFVDHLNNVFDNVIDVLDKTA
jgi:hypothetical protein